MEVITIDSKAFKELAEKIEKIAEFFFSSKATIRKLRKTYLVRQRPTCRYARISTRTLQRLRKDNQIAYTKLRRKCIYRLSDVRESVNSRIVTCDPQTMDDYYKNYMLVTNGKKGGLL